MKEYIFKLFYQILNCQFFSIIRKWSIGEILLFLQLKSLHIFARTFFYAHKTIPIKLTSICDFKCWTFVIFVSEKISKRGCREEWSTTISKQKIGYFTFLSMWNTSVKLLNLIDKKSEIFFFTIFKLENQSDIRYYEALLQAKDRFCYVRTKPHLLVINVTG